MYFYIYLCMQICQFEICQLGIYSIHLLQDSLSHCYIFTQIKRQTRFRSKTANTTKVEVKILTNILQFKFGERRQKIAQNIHMRLYKYRNNFVLRKSANADKDILLRLNIYICMYAHIYLCVSIAFLCCSSAILPQSRMAINANTKRDNFGNRLTYIFAVIIVVVVVWQNCYFFSFEVIMSLLHLKLVKIC